MDLLHSLGDQPCASISCLFHQFTNQILHHYRTFIETQLLSLQNYTIVVVQWTTDVILMTYKLDNESLQLNKFLYYF